MPSEAYQLGNYDLQVFFRHGNNLSIRESIDPSTRDKQYIQYFNIRRGVDEPSSLSFMARDISPSDDLYRKLKRKSAVGAQGSFGEDQLFVDGVAHITWKQILETGNVVKIIVNGEFRGVFFVSTMKRAANDVATGYMVSCIGLQTWLMRQSIFFDIGGELLFARKNKGVKSKFLEKYNQYVTPENLRNSISPKTGIAYIVNKILNGFLNGVYGAYAFTNGSTVTDMIGLALSDVSYYDKNLAIFQITGIFSGTDYSIWDAISQFRSAPFHEIWVTTGGRYITLYDYTLPATKKTKTQASIVGNVYLPAGREYIVFRPTPYDHPKINDAEISEVLNPKKVITVGTLNDISLNTVEGTFSGITLGAEHIIDSELFNSDDNLYSVYKVSATGVKIMSGAADTLWPPVVDNQAMRQVGKRVYTATMEGLDVGGAIKNKNSSAFTKLIEYFRILQAKAYNWFKYNARFNKGTVNIQWLPGIYEGTHIALNPQYADEEGMYYLNAYSMRMDHKELVYSLDLTRGFPFNGFSKAATDYIEKKEDKISDPTRETEKSKQSNRGSPTKESNVVTVKSKIKKSNWTKTPTVKQGSKGGRSGSGGYSYFALYKGGSHVFYQVDNTTGDIVNQVTGQKVGNIATYSPSPKDFRQGAGFEYNTPQRYNSLKKKITGKG